ncbi:MAG: Nif3-like dinuclear metal center hexameric protein [Bacteroidales bacterium]|nr:Nif3-like dinuclear metal center hexameric protein [Bacteroidales bacterium]
MEIKIGDITNAIEKTAPLCWQESYDNAGLTVGNPEMVCSGVLLCLDVFASTLEEASAKNCNLVISHHPFIFRSIKKLPYESGLNKILSLALKNDIAVYSSHTNMDSSSTGVNYALAGVLGLQDYKPLSDRQFEDKNYLGCGLIGSLPKPLTAEEFLNKVKERLGLKVLRYSGDISKEISRVALCGGSGAEFTGDAIKKSCDCFLTGDIKYHNFLDTEERIILADIGHYESEQFIIKRFEEIIKAEFEDNIPIFISGQTNKVKYL